MSFERALKNEASRVRQVFANANAPRMHLSINVEGSCDHGDLVITFNVGEGSWSGEHVKGHNIDQCITEYFRRKGWERDNNAILIPYFEPED